MSKRIKMVIVLVVALVLMWGWYFFIYNREPSIESYTWYSTNEHTKFVKFKEFTENSLIMNGYTFNNYLDSPTYGNYKFFMDESKGIYKIIGQRQWEDEVKDTGNVKFYQKWVTNITFDEETMEYTVKTQVKSMYDILRDKEDWVVWEYGGNCKQTFVTGEEGLNNSIFDISTEANKLDNFMSRIYDFLESLLGPSVL